jgi:hypothetical protein
MKYLGTISGQGTLQRDGVEIAGASYELEGYVQRVGSITGSGEIGLTRAALQSVVDQKDLQLLTANGRLLDIKFSDRKIRSGDHIHVDVSGELPNEAGWRH